MKPSAFQLILLGPLALAGAACQSPKTSYADATNTELAMAVQNPVSTLTRIGVRTGVDGDLEPDDDPRYTYALQPVIPVELDGDWNLVNRIDIPYIDQPDYRGDTDESGLGPITYNFYATLDVPGEQIFGFGPVVVLPTAADDALGTDDSWAVGLAFVSLKTPGNWVLGGQVAGYWNVPADSDTDIEQYLGQVIVNYNLPNGWYLLSTPEITADYERGSGDKWIIPVGGGIGKVFRLGSLPFNFRVQGFRVLDAPDDGPEWQVRAELQMLFPGRGAIRPN